MRLSAQPMPATLPFPVPRRDTLCAADVPVVVEGIPITVRIQFEPAQKGDPPLPFAPHVACRIQVSSPASSVKLSVRA